METTTNIAITIVGGVGAYYYYYYYVNDDYSSIGGGKDGMFAKLFAKTPTVLS